MAAKPTVSLMGRIAVQLKMLTMEQLAESTREQGRQPGKRLGDIFVDKGFISPRQLQQLQKVQRDIVTKHRAEQARSGEPASAGQSPGAARVVSPAQAPSAAAAPAPETAAPAPIARPVQIRRPRDGPGDLELRLPKRTDDDRSRLHEILANARREGASDVHIHAGAPLRFRVNGELREQGSAPIGAQASASLVAAALRPDERESLEREGELDLCYSASGIGRFRANFYREHRGFDAVFRSISATPPTLDELGLPSALAKYTNFHQGMVLVTGPAGCGKSSTLAALVNLINEEREEHILTIEDPIEVLHPSKRCIVNQRHAGHHTRSFARALRAALREDPDVIVIGELRDLETISLALTAAETGHFVLATLHTSNAVRTVGRIIGAFPSNRQDQVRTMLSVSLRTVISQRLVTAADGSGRIPALEVLAINKAIGNLIREQKTIQIRSAIQTGRTHGMMLLEQSLNELVRSGTITRDEAFRFAEDPKLITE